MGTFVRPRDAEKVIRFKFSAEEFDVEKLDEMARANGDVLTETIVRLCVKSKKEE